ncbi:MAG: TatD family hydrolase [Rhodobacteraceae bacterium]|nr:TatD family hydrolase [Paracoccaceae bacterium]
MRLIDIGVNLTNRSFNEDRDAVIRRALDAGVEHMIVTGTSLEESIRAQELVREFPRHLSSTAGAHPHVARDVTRETLSSLESLCAEPGVVAVGETGLDFNRDFSPRPTQEAVFEQQLDLAARTGLPVFIHQRDAHDRLYPILRTFRDRLSQAVIHCFTDRREALWDYLDLDLHIGITGWVCDERRGKELQALVPDVPADRLMLETDAPYLLPRSLTPKPAKNRNEPAWLPHIAETVARLRGVAREQLAEQTTTNAERFFRLR